jgi:hypothetical protein
MNASMLKAELERRGLRHPTSAVVNKERATTCGPATTNKSDVPQPINAARCLLRTSSLVVAVAAKADARTSGLIGTGMVWHVVVPDAVPVPPPLQATAAAPDPSGLGCGPGNIKAQFTGVCPPRPRFNRRTSVPALRDGKTSKHNGRLIYEPHEMSMVKEGDGRGHPNPEFAQRHGLTAASHPPAHTDVCCPLSEHRNANRTAHLKGQSPGKTLATSNKSRAWSRFQLKEAVVFHFLRRGNGLCPTPQLNFKLRDPEADPWFSRPLYWRVLGPGGRGRWRLWRAYNRPHDPRDNRHTAECYKENPNYRTYEDFHERVHRIWDAACIAPEFLSSDKIATRTQARRAAKTRCK